MDPQWNSNASGHGDNRARGSHHDRRAGNARDDGRTCSAGNAAARRSRDLGRTDFDDINPACAGIASNDARADAGRSRKAVEPDRVFTMALAGPRCSVRRSRAAQFAPARPRLGQHQSCTTATRTSAQSCHLAQRRCRHSAGTSTRAVRD